jgi:hypothetical protein
VGRRRRKAGRYWLATYSTVFKDFLPPAPL